MEIPIFQVDAFTSRLFAGNPAAICPLDRWLPEDRMQSIAAENNLAETAFFVPDGERYLLRWFTPTVEVDLCGHATLAAAFVILSRFTPDRTGVRFETKSGELLVTRDGDRLQMDFPSRPPLASPIPAWSKRSELRPAKCSARGTTWSFIATKRNWRPFSRISNC